MTFAEKIESLEAIANEIKTCNACEFCKSRKHVVPGEGNADADLMLIGDGELLHGFQDSIDMLFMQSAEILDNRIFN